jgi:hypothetical protein
MFHDDAYPLAYPEAMLDQFLAGEFDEFRIQVVCATELAARLAEPCDLFISLHGFYFPKQAWPAIECYLTWLARYYAYGRFS